ncbi:MAG: acyltransferase [Desulfobacteraceae bacterium]|nr:acyltransferase [Desulfobacteraceae bacterium]MBC2756734.1 acyltransferase [Desulfobacteraceae bacterium]
MYYSKDELNEMGIKFGRNVQIHRSVLFFGNNIQIGSDVRIDCYSVITSNEPIVLGNNIHIGAGVHIFGTGGVEINSFCNLSSRCSIFTTSDDYSEGYLTNPTIPDAFKKVSIAPVKLEKQVIVGCGSVIMPGVTLGMGAAVGALSFVNTDIPEFTIVAGTPTRKIGKRNQNRLLEMEEKFNLQKKNQLD